MSDRDFKPENVRVTFQDGNVSHIIRPVTLDEAVEAYLETGRRDHIATAFRKGWEQARESLRRDEVGRHKVTTLDVRPPDPEDVLDHIAKHGEGFRLVSILTSRNAWPLFVWERIPDGSVDG